MENELGPVVDGFHMHGFPVRMQEVEYLFKPFGDTAPPMALSVSLRVG